VDEDDHAGFHWPCPAPKVLKVQQARPALPVQPELKDLLVPQERKVPQGGATASYAQRLAGGDNLVSTWCFDLAEGSDSTRPYELIEAYETVVERWVLEPVRDLLINASHFHPAMAAKCDPGAMSCNLTHGKHHQVYAKALAYGPFPVCLIPNAPIKTALQPVKLFEGICKGVRDLGSRFVVQTLWLD
jgi:hypothetical protein